MISMYRTPVGAGAGVNVRPAAEILTAVADTGADADPVRSIAPINPKATAMTMIDAATRRYVWCDRIIFFKRGLALK